MTNNCEIINKDLHTKTPLGNLEICTANFLRNF